LNIKLSANISLEANILDQQIETNGGQLYSNIYHKPSYEPYHLLFNSVHPSHMKKNISFAMLLRAIRYCSKFETYLKEIESLRMTLILNKYPGYLIENQFNRVLLKFKIDQALTLNNYKFLWPETNRISNRRKKYLIFIKRQCSFTYYTTMRSFSSKFYTLWHKYFE